MRKKRWFAVVYVLFIIMQSVITVNAKEIDTSTIEGRKEKAIQLGLAKWIDEDGYFVDLFYEGKSDKELSEMDIDGLVRTLSEEELDAYVELLNAGIMVYTVTKYQKVSQKNPYTGRYLYTGIFEVDGVLAFCIERSAATPAKGSPTGTPVVVTNENIRKVLYYGYNGPGDLGYTYVETAMAAGEANGDGDNALGRNILIEIQAQASPPRNFIVWKVETNGGTTQDLVYYTIEETGRLQLKKTSANPEITSGNEAYSLEGAVYGVYSDAGCTAKIGELKTNASGTTGTMELSAGTYYLKELIAPKGYELSNVVVSGKVVSSQTTTVNVADVPIVIKPEISLMIEKINEIGEQLSGAEFVLYADSNCTHELQRGITNLEGTVLFEDLESDTHYYVKEVTSPEGYENNLEIYEVYLEQVKEDTTMTLQVINRKMMQLPNTGGCAFYYVVAGISLSVIALKKRKKEKQRKQEK